MRTRSSFELKAPSSLHGLAEKVLLARKNCSPVRPCPTHLPACPLPAAYVDLCVFVCCRLLARTELRARWHIEHSRILAPSRSSSTALGCAAAGGAQSPNRVFAPSSCAWCCPHANPPPTYTSCTCSGQVARRSGGAKNSRQIQEWPKNGVFRCACRAHTLALSTIRAHMAERGVLALCFQAPGETAAAMHRLCRPRLCPRVCPRCHLCLTRLPTSRLTPR